MQHLSILGSTGSIGRQTLSVVESLPDRWKIVALAAGCNLDKLLPQIERHHPELVSVASSALADELSRRLHAQGISPLPAIHHGRDGILAVGTHPQTDLVVSAAVGVVGLEATYEAIKLGRTVALSNKEVLVAAGELVMAASAKSGRELLPVDSEHNAVHQCLRAGRRSSGSAEILRDSGSLGGRSFSSDMPAQIKNGASAPEDSASSLATHHSPLTTALYPEVRRIVLTASGGPFRKTPLAQLANVTVDQALAHPNWKMGHRITIDSRSEE